MIVLVGVGFSQAWEAPSKASASGMFWQLPTTWHVLGHRHSLKLRYPGKSTRGRKIESYYSEPPNASTFYIPIMPPTKSIFLGL
jgi:hypothetical protein